MLVDVNMDCQQSLLTPVVWSEVELSAVVSRHFQAQYWAKQMLHSGETSPDSCESVVADLFVQNCWQDRCKLLRYIVHISLKHEVILSELVQTSVHSFDDVACRRCGRADGYELNAHGLAIASLT